MLNHNRCKRRARGSSASCPGGHPHACPARLWWYVSTCACMHLLQSPAAAKTVVFVQVIVGDSQHWSPSHVFFVLLHLVTFSSLTYFRCRQRAFGHGHDVAWAPAQWRRYAWHAAESSGQWVAGSCMENRALPVTKLTLFLPHPPSLAGSLASCRWLLLWQPSREVKP